MDDREELLASRRDSDTASRAVSVECAACLTDEGRASCSRRDRMIIGWRQHVLWFWRGMIGETQVCSFGRRWCPG